MIRANYITVAEFQTFNPELDFTNYSDATISGMIQRASAHADNFLGYTLPVETITLEQTEGRVTPDGSLVIYTKKRPVTSVDAVQIKVGSTVINLSVANVGGNAPYDLTERGDRITFPYQNVEMTGTFSINNFLQLRAVEFFVRTTYRAGYEEIPMDIKDAVNLLTKDIFIRQANPMDLASMSQGNINMSFRTRQDGKSDMVVDAEDKLKDYKRWTA
jgi:hypothetical protein